MHFKPGEKARLLKVPEWILKDLPPDEHQEILSLVGKEMCIESVDEFGYFWIGYGKYVSGDDAERYSGHSFCVTGDCLQRKKAGTNA